MEQVHTLGGINVGSLLFFLPFRSFSPRFSYPPISLIHYNIMHAIKKPHSIADNAYHKANNNGILKGCTYFIYKTKCSGSKLNQSEEKNC